jgi:AcrR family transcriptional regulator
MTKIKYPDGGTRERGVPVRDRTDAVESERRERIFRAIAESVAERGVRGVTFADIAVRAKVSPVKVREEFIGVEDGVTAAFDWASARAGAAMAEAYEGEARWVEAIRAAVAAMLDFIEAEPALARLWIFDSFGAGPKVLRSRAKAVATLCRYIDRGRLEPASRTEPPAITAEGVVGALSAVLQARLPAPKPAPPRELLGELTGLVLLPYLGSAAARHELARPVPRARSERSASPLPRSGRSAVEGVGMKLTYRTARVLTALAERPGLTNREVGNRAEIVDQGQISKLLSRLEARGLVANYSAGGRRGSPNLWQLTPRGEQVELVVRERAQEE